MLNLSAMKNELKELQKSIKQDQATATALMAFLSVAGGTETPKASAPAKRKAGRPAGRPAGKGKGKSKPVSPARKPKAAAPKAKVSDGRGRPLSENSLRAYVLRAVESKPDGMATHEVAAAVKAAASQAPGCTFDVNSETFINQVATCLSKGFRRVSRGIYAIEGAVAAPAPVETPAVDAVTETATEVANA